MEEGTGKALLALFVSVLLVVLSKLKPLLVSSKPKLKLPPGPWTLPVVGSLHHLVARPTIYRSMRELAQKHGPLMLLRFGEVRMMVVTSSEGAQEVMKTQDVLFADRFLTATRGALTFDGNDIAAAPYGERWRQLRKICVLELLSAARVRSFRHIREEEVARFLEKLAVSASTRAAVDLTKMISVFINDAFMRESIGSRCKYQDEYLDALNTAIRHTSTLSVADLFPSSRLMQALSTGPRTVLACRNRIQCILEQIIREKAEAMDRGEEEATESFVGVLLRVQKERSTSIPLTNDTVVAVMFDMFAAGSETSSTTLNWCMTELVRSPAAMARAQAEVREAFKGRRIAITEDGLEGLAYLKLVIKETLRLHPPIPLLPRKSREACQVMGYDIPKDTVVFVNGWAIGRDPRYWEDAEEFRPERFQGPSDIDYRGNSFEYLPFGSGRRSCPGTNLGVGNIELALASLLYHFDWELPHGIGPRDVDVSEAPGLVAGKKTSLILHPVTRIPPATGSA
ncbi:hypothetical protein BS78_05G100000 [Paspalum vaginatum]|uniref:Cytochrome P450 n=1 Tax=Paspalum vaginatum TaxID=158149 RepID=A0A9W8CDA0_9POAL|nr:hypothetical protein BS78_K239900 [Paspalum vaginatum]KAJ1274961.1 hypothetical protein BS78_05G099500 [Paspalum vaginatum]KAJ1274967.1 hypothetical protein BS78_05G100000 [Paspalum vaginatum]